MGIGHTVRLGKNRESESGYIRLQDRSMKLTAGGTTSYDVWIPNPRRFPGKRPAIVRLHGSGRDGTFSSHEGEANLWCNTYGFIVLLPDFRGQGREMKKTTNPGLFSVTQLSDLNDFIRLVKGMPECNGTVGLYGNSQGGFAAAAGSAFSGKAFPEYAYAKGWYHRAETFETIACACAINFSVDIEEALVPGGNQIAFKLEEATLEEEPDSWRESLRGTAQGVRWSRNIEEFRRIYTENDAAELLAFLQNANGNLGGVVQKMQANLAASTVPTLFRWAPDDVWRAWQTSWSWVMAMGSNTVVSISPGGHASEYVATERTVQTNQYTAFFEYHLTGQNVISDITVFGGTDWSDKKEARMVIMPDTSAERSSDSYTYLYKTVNDKSTFGSYTKTSLYVRNNGTLATTAEPTGTGDSDISQAWDTDSLDDSDWYDSVYNQANGGLGPVTSFLLSGELTVGEAIVRLAAQSTDYTIAGVPTATVFVESDKPEFFIEVALFDYNPGTGDETFITQGWKKITGYTSGIEEVDIELGPCCYTVDGANQIQARIATHPVDEYFRAGVDLHFHTRPIFGTDGEYTLTIHHNSTSQTKLDIPLFTAGIGELDP